MAVLVATIFVANGFGHSHRSAMRQAFMITPETLLEACAIYLHVNRYRKKKSRTG